MKAKRVVISAMGGPETVQVQEFNVPEPRENEVRVRVEYAGLAYADIMLRKIKMPGLPKVPFTPGADLTGIVDKLGEKVTGVKKGDRVAVLLMSDFGGQSQYVCVDKEKVNLVPDDVPLEKAVCLIINYLTACKMFEACPNLTERKSGTILVHGGSGGVGSALIQIAVSKGLNVITTVSGPNMEFAEGLGAVPINYYQQDFVKFVQTNGTGKVDAVFDPIGGDYLKRSLKVIKKGGYYIAYGFQKDIEKGMSGVMKSITKFMIKKYTTPGITFLSPQLRDNDPYEYRTKLDLLFGMCAKGEINPMISEIFPIDDAQRAHNNLEQGIRKGKILIKARED